MSTQNKKSMLYVRLGASGLKVSKIILGCMSYGTPEFQPWILTEEEGIKHVKAAYDAGINTFDTADVYSNGASEIVLGKAIKAHNLPRDEIVVMTKCFMTVGRNTSKALLRATPAELDADRYVNQRGLSRKHIFEAIKHSLDRLQLDYVDVLQCHRFDYETPIEETMQALHDVVKAGYVRYIGMSSCWAWQFSVMQNYAIAHNLTPFVTMQNHYSLVYREEEREMMPTLKHFGVGSTPWSPLARGLLSRPLAEIHSTKRSSSDKMIDMYAQSDADNDIVNRVEALAKQKNASMAQVALAWLMQKEGVTAPIIGTTSLDNLQDLLGAVHLELSAEDVKGLEEMYQPRAIIGHF
ncbi:aryl-alcohol dehydrogenase [Athelia psychrophila]|uniref:Aryl-alcohol dehydrogenase n=1 Tax=Athelia psychrophila TaxID=1759441 RepID=A0A166DMF9_9AGAM|nr:aryl-alcohol dehydrogenase [Fibularhizoctonia sp. CBS 109695]